MYRYTENDSFCSRIGWLILVMMFIYFACSICVDQVIRFVTDPFIFNVETNYFNWSYNLPGITICSDYVNESFTREYYQRSDNAWIGRENKTFQDFRHYMNIIGSLNADSMNLIDQFENSTLFRNVSGEDLLKIATNVCTF